MWSHVIQCKAVRRNINEERQIVSAVQNEETATQRNAHIPRERSNFTNEIKVNEKAANAVSVEIKNKYFNE